MKKIKILHISETFVSGVYTYIKNINHYMSKYDDVENYVIYSGERDHTKDDLIKAEFNPKVHLIKVKMAREINAKQDFTSLKELISLIKKIQPDAIHVHSSKAGVLGRVAHIAYPKSKLYYTPNGYSFLREDVSKTRRKMFYFLEKAVTKIFGGTIVACGDEEYKYALQLGKSTLIRNGVDIEFLNKYYNKNYKNERLTIGTCGRISYQKNPKLFNEIALTLPQYDFVWIGDGELRSEITAPNITVAGWQTHHETLNMVNKLDVFLSTSLWEGLPFNIIEAMVLRKPIVSLDIESNRITVSQNESGYICKNVPEFVKSLKFFESKENIDKFGEESFKRAKSLFDMNKNFEDLEKLYRKV